MSEEMNVQAPQGAESSSPEKSKKSKTLLLVVIAAVAVVAAAVIAIIAFLNSPSYKAKEQVKLGEKYLSELMYEDALLAFENALQIDPNNKTVLEAVQNHLEEFYAAAAQFASKGQYELEKRVANIILLAKPDEIKANILVADAEELLGNGIAADEIYQEIFAKETSKELEELVSQDEMRFYRLARRYGSEGKYEIEKKIADCLVNGNQDFALGYVAKGESYFGQSEFMKASEEISQAKQKNADAEEIGDLGDLCDSFMGLADAIASGDTQKIVTFIKSNDFKVIKKFVNDGASLYLGGDKPIAVRKQDNMCQVYYDGVNKELSGTFTGIYVANDNYFVYVGEFADGLPQGNGTLYVANINEGLDTALIYKGQFSQGYFNNGTINFEEDGARGEFAISADSEGLLQVNEYSNQKAVLWADSNGDLKYYVMNASVNTMKHFVIGLCGTDVKLQLSSPKSVPVITVDLILANVESYSWGAETYYYLSGQEYGGVPDRKGITASDEYDGDLTSKIQKNQKRIKSFNGYNDDWNYGLEVEYTVTNSFGNQASVTVVYDVMDECGWMGYYVYKIIDPNAEYE